MLATEKIQGPIALTLTVLAGRIRFGRADISFSCSAAPNYCFQSWKKYLLAFWLEGLLNPATIV